MSIQFFCPSCGQPIEVDDEMANQNVTCPYCRSAAQTPGTSDPRVRSSAPPADSVEGPATAPVATVAPVTDGMAYGQPAPENKSVLGWVALGCMVAAVISIAVVYPTISNIMKSLPQLGPQPTPEEVQQQQVLMQQAMAPHAWVGPVGFLGVCVLPLAGLVVSIVALVKRSQPRWPAVVSLVLMGVVIVAICGGGVMMQAAQQAGP